MASKMRFTEAMLKRNPNLSRFPHYYNIEKAVGANCPNLRDDVMLVQFMLKLWVQSRDSGFVIDPPLWDVALHGKLDNPTLAFLILFQVRNSSVGKSDGRFDPLTLDHMDGATSSLASLNLYLWANKFDVFKDFSVAPGLPGPLVPLLKK